MSSKIRVLSDHIINKIAAGEVIENPSSVVKELVENSLDAGATDICIEIQGGGRQLIRVSDNGCGMNSDDALLCLERHATSKLRNVEDIHSLSTMGFRGEAIPSIASISKFNLLTCVRSEKEHEQSGTMVIVDGGKIISCSPAARAPGTTIEVKSLFFNVPVRKKFLKSPTVDANEILKTLSLVALGFPEIKFQLISDGKAILTTPFNKEVSFLEKLKARIDNVLGKDFADHVVPVAESKGEMGIEGVVGLPYYTRHNRAGQYLFINKRAVVSPLIAFAVKEAFGTSLPNGRFPVFVLHLTINGDLVDVNVHPQKREVRLRQEQIIKELLIKAVRNGLHRESEEGFPVENTFKDHSSSFVEEYKPSAIFSSVDIPETWVFKQKLPEKRPEQHPKPSHCQTKEALLPSTLTDKVMTLNSPNHPVSQGDLALSFPRQRELPLQILGTLPSYIILDVAFVHPFIKKGGFHFEKGGLFIIDQRKAHHRVLFEKLLQECNGAIAQQTLLIPQSIELSSYEAEILRRHLSFFSKMGIHIQDAGTNCFLLDAVPHLFGKFSVETYVKEIILDFVASEIGQSNEQAMLQERMKQIALSVINKVVPAHKRLSLVEAQVLIDQLMGCQNPYTCPLGKPTLIQLSSDELAKLFQR